MYESSGFMYEMKTTRGNSEQGRVVGVETLQDVHHERLAYHLRPIFDVVLGEIGVERLVLAVIQQDGHAMRPRHLSLQFLGGRMLQNFRFFSHSFGVLEIYCHLGAHAAEVAVGPRGVNFV